MHIGLLPGALYTPLRLARLPLLYQIAVLCGDGGGRGLCTNSCATRDVGSNGHLCIGNGVFVRLGVEGTIESEIDQLSK